MGDRALILKSNQFGTIEYSPVLYLHWQGESVPGLLDELREVMRGREGDLSYSFARLVAVACKYMDGNLSIGVHDRPDDFEESTEYLRGLSHGDAGVVICNCSDYSWYAEGGYLTEPEYV